MKRNAILSPDLTYRYLLTREWNADMPKVMWVMLNPSTADAEVDDNTIRRCRTFTVGMGWGGVDVVNLFAWRATKPKDLKQAEIDGHDIVGGENTDWWLYASRGAPRIICAWGANPLADRYQAGYFQHIFDGEQLWCLGRTKSGAPRHPLYVPSDTPLERFNEV